MKKSVSLFLVLSIVISLFVTTPISVSAATGNDIVNDLINNYVGKYQYVLNTHGPNTFDCTGLVYYVYKQYGISLPYTTKTNWKQYGTVIYNTSELKSGDILLFGSSESQLNHAGIYDANGGYIIHALNSNYDITRQPTLYTWMNNSSWNSQGSNQFQYAVRVLNDVHTHSFWLENEAVHPHREYRRCSCGYTEYTGNTGYYSTCATCTTPGKPSFVDVKSLYGTNKGVYVGWTATANTTNYSIVFEKKNDSGSYQTDMIVTWATAQNYYDLEVGDYRMYIQSINQNVTLSGSHPWTNSDYHYFTVTDEYADVMIEYKYSNNFLMDDELSGYLIPFDVVCENVEYWIIRGYYEGELTGTEKIIVNENDLDEIVSSDMRTIISKKANNIYECLFEVRKIGLYEFEIVPVNDFGETRARTFEFGYALSEDNGTCGENLKWTYSNGTLTISGKGEMYDYSRKIGEKAPWYRFGKHIYNIVLEKGITSIGNYAFYGCSALREIEFPNGIVKIGKSAFYDADNLKVLTIPKSLVEVGEYAFGGTREPFTVYYEGGKEDWNKLDIYKEWDGISSNSNYALVYAKIQYADDINVYGISFDETFTSLLPDETTTITVEIFPENATNKNVIWTTSDEKVAMVDENGVVTAVGVGKATITATTEDGGFSASCEVLVDKPITSTTYKELTATYKFYVECESELNNELLAVACYDETGRVIALEQIECDGDTSYTASVPKDTNIKYAKVFVWSDYSGLEPIAIAELVEVN